LLILWPFGPVALVFDVMDTEGAPLPKDVTSFFARGSIDEGRLAEFKHRIEGKNIEWRVIDAGDKKAGLIRVIKRPMNEIDPTHYRMFSNGNHKPPVQFSTIAHELGHLFLGHLGHDKKLKVPKRKPLSDDQIELEAESVSYIVCSRNGVQSKSESYLTNYVDNNTTVDQIDIYRVMRAAGQVETLLGLTAHTKYDRPT
jgi:hypothetical protein